MSQFSSRQMPAQGLPIGMGITDSPAPSPAHLRQRPAAVAAIGPLTVPASTGSHRAVQRGKPTHRQLQTSPSSSGVSVKRVAVHRRARASTRNDVKAAAAADAASLDMLLGAGGGLSSVPETATSGGGGGRASKIGVLLLNLGGPETLDDVQPFLFNLFADPVRCRAALLCFAQALRRWPLLEGLHCPLPRATVCGKLYFAPLLPRLGGPMLPSFLPCASFALGVSGPWLLGQCQCHCHCPCRCQGSGVLGRGVILGSCAPSTCACCTGHHPAAAATAVPAAATGAVHLHRARTQIPGGLRLHRGGLAPAQDHHGAGTV